MSGAERGHPGRSAFAPHEQGRIPKWAAKSWPLRPGRPRSVIFTPLLAAILVSVALTGCGEKPDSPSGSTLSVKPRQNTLATATPSIEPILTAWQQGDQAGAAARVLETDWKQRPLFSSGTTLSLSEAQFQALPSATREAKSPEMLAQVGELKKLAEAVAQSGRDAAARKDIAQARKHFVALKGFGDALDGPECLGIVRLTGQAVRKKAAAESAKLGM